MDLALFVDATSLFAYQQYLKEHEYPVQGNINYGALLAALTYLAMGHPPESLSGQSISSLATSNGPVPFNPMFAFVAINPEHEGQQKFCAFLRGQGFTVDETDFRDAFILPKSMHRESSYQRLSTRLTYMAGMLTAPCDNMLKSRKIPHIVIVTDAFDVYYPFLDYVENRGGQATIASFRRGMEDRWQRAGLFDEGSVLGFWDLSPAAKEIIGVDLGSSVRAMEGGKGLADFKL